MLSTRVPIDERQLTVFCKEFGVAKLLLFGSVLRSDFDQKHSDIDVLVGFLANASKSLFTLIEMERTLSQLFGRSVDLNTPSSLSKYFRDEVLASAEVLYVAA